MANFNPHTRTILEPYPPGTAVNLDWSVDGLLLNQTTGEYDIPYALAGRRAQILGSEYQQAVSPSYRYYLESSWNEDVYRPGAPLVGISPYIPHDYFSPTQGGAPSDVVYPYRSVVFVRKDIWRENEASEYVLAAKADQRVLLDSEATTSRGGNCSASFINEASTEGAHYAACQAIQTTVRKHWRSNPPVNTYHFSIIWESQ